MLRQGVGPVELERLKILVIVLYPRQMFAGRTQHPRRGRRDDVRQDRIRRGFREPVNPVYLDIVELHQLGSHGAPSGVYRHEQQHIMGA
jgi:O-phosphoseryl-tRNA(Cys) synthetase